jgi:hypothetical protein
MDVSATRYNKGKREWSLVSFTALEGLVDVLSFGLTKYSRDNWKKGLKQTETADSLMRHLFAYLRGEDKDPETGLSHISHVQCNAMFMEHFDGTEWDNRTVRENTGQLKLMLEDMGKKPYKPINFQKLYDMSMQKATQIDLVRNLVSKYSKDDELGAAIRNTIIGAE